MLIILIREKPVAGLIQRNLHYNARDNRKRVLSYLINDFRIKASLAVASYRMAEVYLC